MGFLVLIAALVVVAGVVGAVALAVNAKRDYSTGNQVVPGRPTSAPAEWAGAHTPEARLHRRLVDAVAALRAHPLLEEGTGMLEARVSLEEVARSLDEQLVAAAALPERVRDEPLARIAEQVDQFEQDVATVTAAGGALTAGDHGGQQQVADIKRQLDERARTQAELDGPSPVERPQTDPPPTDPPQPAPPQAAPPQAAPDA